MFTALKLIVALGATLILLGVLGTSQDSWVYAHFSGAIGAGALGVLFLVTTLLTPRRHP